MLRVPTRDDDDLDPNATADVPSVVALDLDNTSSALIAPKIAD